MRESGDLIHQTERVKLRGGVPLSTARTRFCMHENDKAVAEHLPCILRCVYIPESDPLVPNLGWPLPKRIELNSIGSYGNGMGLEGYESIGYNSQSNINLADRLIRNIRAVRRVLETNLLSGETLYFFVSLIRAMGLMD